jgi:hypothetical protein
MSLEGLSRLLSWIVPPAAGTPDPARRRARSHFPPRRITNSQRAGTDFFSFRSSIECANGFARRDHNAEGEFQAAEKMVQAAAMMSKEPIALQLRFLQTMREISSEHNTTTFLPVPIDLFTSLVRKNEQPEIFRKPAGTRSRRIARR